MGKLSKLLDRAGDMFMPKELAPFASILAPMLVGPGFGNLGMGLGLGLGQLASAKMHSGKLDPFNALAVFGAGMTPEARAMRMRGRIDPSQGTIGQKLSGGIADAFGGTGMGQTNAGQIFTRALDPTQSMLKNEYGNYFESNAMAKALAGEGSGIGLGSEYILPEKEMPTFDEAMKADYESYYGKKAAVEPGGGYEFDEDFDPSTGDIGATKTKTTKGNLTDEEFKGYLKAKDKDAYLASLSRRTVDAEGNIVLGGDQGFFSGATEGVAGSLFPGFSDSFDPMTGKATGFDFTKALTTIGMATTLSQMLPLAEKLKREKIEDEKKQAAIWKKWFDGYENISGIAYIDSPYPDANLIQKYKRFMMATGGRVGYNMGGATGIIAAAPGMPEGMQIDGRDGMFISQGVEEKADDVPAMLSKNEFVLTADAMKGFDKMSGGNGDPRAAAQKMYQMMNQMEAMA